MKLQIIVHEVKEEDYWTEVLLFPAVPRWVRRSTYYTETSMRL